MKTQKSMEKMNGWRWNYRAWNNIASPNNRKENGEQK
jgi:hypothetical protein